MTLAPPPFNHPKADVILRSSDDIDFCVFKLFLSLASPHFDTVFNSPQSPYRPEAKAKLSVMSLPENSSTIDILLRFCYPSTLVDDPDLGDPGIFKILAEVVCAAKKYSVEVITKKVGLALSDAKVLEKDPFRVFAVARHSQLEKETRLAATYTLRQPLIPPKIPELNLISAMDLLKLLDYRIQCTLAVRDLKNLPLLNTPEWTLCPVHSPKNAMGKKKVKLDIIINKDEGVAVENSRGSSWKEN
ncbi:hypothetical protein SERLA73DRAFT_170317 [Serpula lacrymans var. lacrymans S7.3]|uniref:BTB domain-containing protein n=1 Tax=Serpula lacrymans var. lacrymans (strain S7.3) TaxID=936435 RepID=F8Q4D3_SERL3|nr:hypothetical protein SERLA73DRAFT_170317 [Serpula lacrymans var. lacrymans S7.3]